MTIFDEKPYSVYLGLFFENSITVASEHEQFHLPDFGCVFSNDTLLSEVFALVKKNILHRG